MGTKIWDPGCTPEQGPERTPKQGPERTPEQGPEQDPEWKMSTFRAGFSFVHFRTVLDPKWPGNGNPSDDKADFYRTLKLASSAIQL